MERDINVEWKLFDDYMKELGIRLFCPVCGSSGYMTDLTELPSKIEAPEMRPALMIICQECSSIRLFSLPRE